jgi:cytochrome P450
MSHTMMTGEAHVPADPFRADRIATGVRMEEMHGESLLMLLRWRDVRAAARDVAQFDSGQLGRVPTPPEDTIRDFRQLPIETNPPEHTAWKALVQPFFRRPKEPGPKAEIEALVAKAVTRALGKDRLDAVAGFALPLQSAALAVLLDTDRALAAEWQGWELHAFRTDGQTDPAKARRYLEFIDRMLAAGQAAPDHGLFSYLHRARFQGRPLTQDEKRGICHLAMAGGRDTVINTITGVLGYLAAHPEDLGRLRAEPGLIDAAAEEVFRVLSPLPQIARVCPQGLEWNGLRIAPDARASLCWASANRDETVFDAPLALKIDRKPNPHVAFGAGDHTCLGAPHARLILRTLLAELTRQVAGIETLSARPRHTQFGTPYLYDHLTLRLHRLAAGAERIG